MLDLAPEELIVDSFAGGGGASVGIERALGRAPDIAINHDSKALAMHAANHPSTLHVCEDVWRADLRKLVGGRKVGLLWASPDCKHFSRAKGSVPVSKEIRSLAWVVVRWASQVRPRCIFLENVREFADWAPLVPRWECRCGWRGTEGQALLMRTRRRCPRCESKAIRATVSLVPDPDKKGMIFRLFCNRFLGFKYQIAVRNLDAANTGAPTHRRRLFFIARCDGQPIEWPEPTHGDPKLLDDQPLFTRLKPWRPAAEIIDWERPCPSIFTRKRPLAEKTLRRIEIGLKKFVGQASNPFIVKMRGTSSAVSAGEPLPSITAGGTHEGLAVPFVTQISHTGSTGRASYVHSPQEPMRTVTASGEHALVAPFMVGNSGPTYGAKPRPVTEPLNTILCDNRAAVAAPFLVPNFGERDGQEARTHAVDEPLPAVTSHGAGQLALPFLVKYHGGKDPERDGTERSHGVDQPLPTIDTQPRYGLSAPFFLPRSGYHDAGKMDKPPPRSVEEPLPTIIASDTPGGLVLPFLTEYYGTGGARGVEEPLTTVTSKHRHGLVLGVFGEGASAYEDYFAALEAEYGRSEAMRSLIRTMRELGVYDIGFRMLDVDELAAAQGFPAGYKLHGTKADRIKLVGNAVCPGVMRAICQAIGEAA